MPASDVYNRFGNRLPEYDIRQVVSPSYLDANNELRWQKNGNKGFDISKQPIRLIYLEKGTRIIRYGPEAGYYAAPSGTTYESLAMPYQIRTCEYNEYEVVEDGIVQVEKIDVEVGIVAVQPAWPNEKGGGIQYHFPHENEKKTVLYYVGRGLRRLGVSEWTSVMQEDSTHA